MSWRGVQPLQTQASARESAGGSWREPLPCTALPSVCTGEVLRANTGVISFEAAGPPSLPILREGVVTGEQQSKKQKAGSFPTRPWVGEGADKRRTP